MKIHPSRFSKELQKLSSESGKTFFVIDANSNFYFKKTQLSKKGSDNYVYVVSRNSYEFIISSNDYPNLPKMAIVINSKDSYVRSLAVDKPDKHS